VVEPTGGKAFDEELAFAHELADLAGEIGLGFFRGTFEVTIKPDQTPVTEADLSIASPATASWARRAACKARAGDGGSSIRSTGRRTSPTASRSGRT
jgi:hypothetical protein